METKYQTTKRLTQEVIDEIITLDESGELTAETLLERAKDKDSILHDFFEWNDSEAGIKYRLHQARILINEIKIVVEDKVISGFENVSIVLEEGETKRVYKPVFQIMSNEEQRMQIIQRAIAHQEYWAEQYKQYSELAPIVAVIKKTKASLNKQWQKKKK
jgi:hypothetical protein